MRKRAANPNQLMEAAHLKPFYDGVRATRPRVGLARGTSFRWMSVLLDLSKHSHSRHQLAPRSEA
jgi:hypothetical protein